MDEKSLLIENDQIIIGAYIRLYKNKNGKYYLY